MSKNKITSYPKEKIKILLLENISDVSVDEFKSNGYIDVHKIKGSISEEDLIREIKGVHILGIRSKTQITDNILSSADKLLAIGCYCIGTNQVDLISARKKGIAVFNAPHANTRSVAELVIGLSIMLMRKIIPKNNASHIGDWLKDSNGCFEIRGKTIGIVGYGNIGSQVSVMAESLGMSVIFYDIEPKLPLGNSKQITSFSEFLSKSDIVTLHVPEDSSTHNLIDITALCNMKVGSVLLNYSRGSVVDLEALKFHIESGHLSGAAIDVFPFEPKKSGDNFYSILQGLDNVILTPHIGGSTEEAQYNIGLDVTSKIINFIEKGITLGSQTIPNLSLPIEKESHRILHIHRNKPGVLSEINLTLSSNGINILGQYLKTNDDIGYVVLDVDKDFSKKAIKLLRSISGSIKVRVLY